MSVTPEKNQTTSAQRSTDRSVSDRLETFCQVLRDEATAILAGADRVGPEIEQVINLLERLSGRLILTGLGKAGHVARKAAATFCSTGTPALYLHPSEALHGDLGIVSAGDLLIAISNSGQTAEVLNLLPSMARFGVPVVAITGNLNSPLALRSTVVIDSYVIREADPIAGAPTSSTTLQMAICDALAVTLMTARGFSGEQFAIFHPGGNLGRKLLLKVADLMRVGDSLPIVPQGESLQQAIQTISAKRLGAAMIVDPVGRLIGILTDGDLRRWFQLASDTNRSLRENALQQAMTHQPRSIAAHILAAEALKIMEDHQITVLAVVDETQQLVGAIHLHDLIRAGLA